MTDKTEEVSYEPKPESGWRQRPSANGCQFWGLMLDPDEEAGPAIFVTISGADTFVISYSPASFVHQCPCPHHIQRVEIDFAVGAWSVLGVTQDCVTLQAVGKKP